jgi:hypothetical protein
MILNGGGALYVRSGAHQALAPCVQDFAEAQVRKEISHG